LRLIASLIRYIRYKSLTSARQEGTCRFGPKDWVGLPDGEYLFSIDTGSIESGADASDRPPDGLRLPPSSGAADARLYCVSERLRIVGEKVVGTIGRAHGAPLQPSTSAVRSREPVATLLKPVGEDESDESDEGEEGEQQQYMFAVPVLEWADPHDETADVKKMYAMVDRLSYLDWGLRTDDEISGKRVAAKQRDTWDGCIVHDGAMWGEAHGENAMRVSDKGPKTAVTSEGYGEATVATVEKLLRLLRRLTRYVPAMAEWPEVWNLTADSTFIDVGSGYGKVVMHAKLNLGCRCAVGIECVAKRVEISIGALQGLYGELDRAQLADDLLRGVSFEAVDACSKQALDYSHIYMFDRVFSEWTLAALAPVLQRSSFYIFLSTRKPHVWWGHGFTKIQPIAKIRFKTTGKEGMTAFVYVNSEMIPGLAGMW